MGRAYCLGRNLIGSGWLAHDVSSGRVGWSTKSATILDAHEVVDRTLWPLRANSIHWA